MTAPEDPTHWLKTKAFGAGFVQAGVARLEPLYGAAFYRAWVDSGWHGGLDYLARSVDLRADPRTLLTGARSALVVALSYAQPNPVRPGGVRIARYALGRDYHRVMRGRLARLAREAQRQWPAAEFRACVDSAPLLERELAHRAGLGWWGKNTLLIDSRRGSWFLIGVLLTSLELIPDAPAVGGCGTCQICVDACPTGAIRPLGDRWAVDAGECLSTWTIERAEDVRPDRIAQASGEWTFGCDICQEVCPFNQPRPGQPERGGPPADSQLRARRPFPSLTEAGRLAQDEWNALTEGSPLRRAGFAGFQASVRHNSAHPRQRQGGPSTGSSDESGPP